MDDEGVRQYRPWLGCFLVVDFCILGLGALVLLMALGALLESF